MNTGNLSEAARQRARNHHAQGLNCAESTLRGVLEVLREEGVTDISLEATLLASGLGGGIGGSGATCGALIGASMAVGAVHGRKDPYALATFEERRDQLNGPEGLYRVFNNLVHDFKKTMGTTSCAELTCPYDYRSEERKQFCRNIIGDGAALAVAWTIRALEEGYRLPYRYNIMGDT